MTINKLTQEIARTLDIRPEDLAWKTDQSKFDADLVLILAPLLSKYQIKIQDLRDKLESVLKKYLSDLDYEFVGSYLNIKLSIKFQIGLLIDKLEQAKSANLDYGQLPANNQLAVVDFIGLNIAKPFSVGHIRPTVQGWAIIQILRNAGYSVVGDNHLGDWGTPFGMWVYAYKHWGNKQAVEERGVYELNDLYIKFRQALSQEPNLIDQAKRELIKLANKDPETIELYNWFYDLSL